MTAIAVDARQAYRPDRRGMGNVLVALLRELAAQRPDWRFRLFHQMPAAADPFADVPNITRKRIDIPAGDRLDLWERVRPAGGFKASVWQRLRLLPRAMVGMQLAHLGIAVFIFGVSMVKSFEIERDVKMDIGESTQAGGYTFTFQGVRDVQGPNYQAAQGLVVVTRGDREIAQMRPEKRVYRVQQNPMTEAAIRSRPWGDIYVSLGQPVQGQAWVVRVYYKPFVTWIWGGCVLMALGGLLAASDRRYRNVKQTADQGLGTPAAVPGLGKAGGVAA